MEFLEFKNKYFEGDEEKAMSKLAYEGYNEDYELTGSKDALKQILNTMDRKTANKYMEFLREEIRKQPKKLKQWYSIEQILQKINMTGEEVAKTDKNPFVKKFWFSIIIIFVGIFVMMLLLVIKRAVGFESQQYDSLVSYGTTIFIGIRSITATGVLMNVFNFKKAKKHINENLEDFITDTTEEEKEAERQDTVKTRNNNDDFEEITRAYCLKELMALYKDRKEMYLIVAIASVVLFGLCSMGSVVWVIPAIICPVICVIMRGKQSKRLKDIHNLNFYITTNVCAGKKIKIDSDDNRVYSKKLIFSDGSKYEIHLAYKGIQFQTMYEDYLYNSINTGDTCYTMHIGKQKKISLVFPVNEFKLADNEFINRGGCYYPIKDTNAEDILIQETKLQYEEFPSIQKKAVEDAENAIEKAFKGQKTFKIFSVIVLALTLLGIASEEVQILNLLLQPFLFIIPSIPALKGIFKAKSAVDRVTIDYMEYYKLRDKQQAAAMSIIILIVDMLLYLGNFALFINRITY